MWPGCNPINRLPRLDAVEVEHRCLQRLTLLDGGGELRRATADGGVALAARRCARFRDDRRDRAVEPAEGGRQRDNLWVGEEVVPTRAPTATGGRERSAEGAAGGALRGGGASRVVCGGLVSVERGVMSGGVRWVPAHRKGSTASRSSGPPRLSRRTPILVFSYAAPTSASSVTVGLSANAPILSETDLWRLLGGASGRSAGPGNSEAPDSSSSAVTRSSGRILRRAGVFLAARFLVRGRRMTRSSPDAVGTESVLGWAASQRKSGWPDKKRAWPEGWPSLGWPRPEFRFEGPQICFINMPDSGPNLQKICLKIPACS